MFWRALALGALANMIIVTVVAVRVIDAQTKAVINSPVEEVSLNTSYSIYLETNEWSDFAEWNLAKGYITILPPTVPNTNDTFVTISAWMVETNEYAKFKEWNRRRK